MSILRIVPLVLAVVALTLACSSDSPTEPRDGPVPVQRLFYGLVGLDEPETELVIRDRAAFEELWRRIAGSAPPAVDFQNNQVAAIVRFLSDGCKEAEITGAELRFGTLIVHVRNQVPGPNCGCIQVASNRAEIVLLPRLGDAPVAFDNQRFELRC